MKVVAINGSPRKGGNTAQCLEVMAKEFEREGIEFEVLQPGANVKPCMACYHCLNTGSLHCVQTGYMSTRSSTSASRPTASCWHPRFITAVSRAA